MRIIRKYNKQEQAIFPELAAQTVLALEENQEQDFLGSIFMELNLGNESGGQFFTPYHICELMAEIALSDDVVRQVNEQGYITMLRSRRYIDCWCSCCKEAIGERKSELSEPCFGSRTGYR